MKEKKSLEYINKPLTPDVILDIKYEMEKSGYDIPYVNSSSNNRSISLDRDHIMCYTRERGAWEEAGEV